MPQKSVKVLFVSHTAKKNGAPSLLLGILNELKNVSDIPFRILLVEGGELEPEFRAIAKTYSLNWTRKVPAGMRESMTAIIAKVFTFIKTKYIRFRVRDTTHVFLNTIVNGDIQQNLLGLKSKFICYVHELEYSIHSSTSPKMLRTTLRNTDFFMAASNAVMQNLSERHKVSEEKMKVIYASIPTVIREKSAYSGFIESFKARSHIDSDAIVIGTMAGNEWRKGFDLFLPLALVYFNLFPQSNVYFVWKGFVQSGIASFGDLYDYEKFKLGKKVLLIPRGSDSLDQMACFDIHLLLSREDPYPLVVLEAASFAIPTVCFHDSGGSPEFIQEDCGFVVPYGDLIKMAERIHILASDHETRIRMGATAQQKVRLRHDQRKATEEIVNTLKSL